MPADPRQSPARAAPRVLSILLAWHLVATALGTLPDPSKLPKFEPRPGPAGGVTTLLDGVIGRLAFLPDWLWNSTALPRRIADGYLRLTGLGQRWLMFGNPPQYDQYVRVRYYVAGGNTATPTWMATELAMPSGREDRPRLLRAYRDSFEDKAYDIAWGRFSDRRTPDARGPDTQPQQLPDDLAPFARYLARRFSDTHLAPGERIVRTEVWFGQANNAPADAPLDPAALAARRAVLLELYDGPVVDRVPLLPYPPYHGGDWQADIHWILEYFELP